MTVKAEHRGNVLIVEINRPERRNAVDKKTAEALYNAFKDFDEDEALSVAILTGAEGNFCAGADLQALAEGQGNKVRSGGDFGPMGPSRLQLSKPVIAAIEGYAVAGGIELALWADLRVAAKSAVLGVFCRRFGVPLVDLGTIRLPRLIGQSRANDLVLTGRPVRAEEAFEIGLVNRLVDDGQALSAAISLANDIAAHPQNCVRSDRQSMFEQWSLPTEQAIINETHLGLATIRSGETVEGAAAFKGGDGRHGRARTSN